MAITELVQSNPRVAIIILSFIVTLFITIVTYFMTDRKRMKEIRDKQKHLKKELKKYKHDPAKMMEINKQMMEDLPEQLKHSMKPALITIIPLLILFGWLRSVYEGTALASKAFLFPSWVWWYIGASILFSTILRKMFGLQ